MLGRLQEKHVLEMQCKHQRSILELQEKLKLNLQQVHAAACLSCVFLHLVFTHWFALYWYYSCWLIHWSSCIPVITEYVILEMLFAASLRKYKTQINKLTITNKKLKKTQIGNLKLYWTQLLTHVCVCYCAQLLYTTQHGTVLIIFALNLQSNCLSVVQKTTTVFMFVVNYWHWPRLYRSNECRLIQGCLLIWLTMSASNLALRVAVYENCHKYIYIE